jgi:putative hydrolase of the HAD superfamily
VTESPATRFPIDADRVRAVVFDLGGVLIEGGPSEVVAFGDRTGLAPEVWHELRRELFGNEGSWARLERGELAFDAFVAELHRRIIEAGGELSVADAAGFMGRPTPMGSGAPMRPAMIDAVRELRSVARTALLTNNVAEWRDGWSRFFNDPELFDVVVDSSEVGTRKPEAPIYEATREKLGVRHEEILFIDDIGQNLKAARSLGWQTHLFTNERDTLALLRTVMDRP